MSPITQSFGPSIFCRLTIPRWITIHVVLQVMSDDQKPLTTGLGTLSLIHLKCLSLLGSLQYKPRKKDA